MNSKLERHPLSTAWPDLSEEEFATLGTRIAEHGYDRREPIVLYQGYILDGWHRYQVALANGIDPPVVEFDGDDPVGFVIARQCGRRNLTPGQRAEAIVRVRNWAPEGRPKSTGPDGLVPRKEDTSTESQMAEEANVSVRTIKRAKAKVRAERGEDVPAARRAGPKPEQAFTPGKWTCSQCGTECNHDMGTCTTCGLVGGENSDNRTEFPKPAPSEPLGAGVGAAIEDNFLESIERLSELSRKPTAAADVLVALLDESHPYHLERHLSSARLYLQEAEKAWKRCRRRGGR